MATQILADTSTLEAKIAYDNTVMQRHLIQLGGVPLEQSPYLDTLRTNITPNKGRNAITLWVIIDPQIVLMNYRRWNLSTPQSVVAYVPKVWSIYYNFAFDTLVEVTKMQATTSYHILLEQKLSRVATGSFRSTTYNSQINAIFVPPSSFQVSEESPAKDKSSKSFLKKWFS